MTERITISFRDPRPGPYGDTDTRHAYVIHVSPAIEDGYYEATVHPISKGTPAAEPHQFKSEWFIGAYTRAVSAVQVLPANQGLQFYPEKFEHASCSNTLAEG